MAILNYRGATVKGNTANTRAQPTSSATSVLAANDLRIGALILNKGSVTVYLGNSSSVTTANGYPLDPNEEFYDDDSRSDWYGITSSGTGDLAVLETTAVRDWNT